MGYFNKSTIISSKTQSHLNTYCCNGTVERNPRYISRPRLLVFFFREDLRLQLENLQQSRHEDHREKSRWTSRLTLGRPSDLNLSRDLQTMQQGAWKQKRRLLSVQNERMHSSLGGGCMRSLLWMLVQQLHSRRKETIGRNGALNPLNGLKIEML